MASWARDSWLRPSAGPVVRVACLQFPLGPADQAGEQEKINTEALKGALCPPLQCLLSGSLKLMTRDVSLQLGIMVRPST